ncbi:hypothetical protein I3843_09G176400 [Carya illinoinensis]|nr:hypothetical protein I3843_09G176400 [Carya illinoinensis]
MNFVLFPETSHSPRNTSPLSLSLSLSLSILFSSPRVPILRERLLPSRPVSFPPLFPFSEKDVFPPGRFPFPLCSHSPRNTSPLPSSFLSPSVPIIRETLLPSRPFSFPPLFPFSEKDVSPPDRFSLLVLSQSLLPRIFGFQTLTQNRSVAASSS